MKIEEATPVTVTDLWGGIESRIRRAKNLEEAAQEVAKALHSRFGESVALARVFFTVSFDSLPKSKQDFVRDLAESAGGASSLTGSTPVLSLLGTYGSEGRWTDVNDSKGHVGIPLISADFVAAIPMISRLLKDLGVPLDWIDKHDASAIQKSLGETASAFFVEDASEATDDQGRKIIVAQDFVAEYGIRTVFGIGGAYPRGDILVMVVFCRDQFSRSLVEQFLPLVTLFKTATEAMTRARNIFAAS
jgi:histone H3/H4